jgi:hypothetical protein
MEFFTSNFRFIYLIHLHLLLRDKLQPGHFSKDTEEWSPDEPLLLPRRVNCRGQRQVLQRLQREDSLRAGSEHGGCQKALGDKREAHKLAPSAVMSMLLIFIRMICEVKCKQ